MNDEKSCRCCTCGFEWDKGKDSMHSCSAILNEKLQELKLKYEWELLTPECKPKLDTWVYFWVSIDKGPQNGYLRSRSHDDGEIFNVDGVVDYVFDVFGENKDKVKLRPAEKNPWGTKTMPPPIASYKTANLHHLSITTCPQCKQQVWWPTEQILKTCDEHLTTFKEKTNG